MPTITTLRDVNKKYKKNKVQYKSPKQYTREKLYQLPQWRKLRNTYLMKHPLDELE